MWSIQHADITAVSYTHLDHPAKVKKHDEINYDISVKNGETSFLLNAIKVEDILPSGLDIQLDAIAWYLGNDSTKQQLVKDSQFVEVMQDAKNKQKLIFTIEALQVEQDVYKRQPQKHIMPGVLMLEALAQTVAVMLLSKEENKGKIGLFAGINKARFKRQVIPGDKLTLTCEVTKERMGIVFVNAVATVDDEVAVSGELMFAIDEA